MGAIIGISVAAALAVAIGVIGTRAIGKAMMQQSNLYLAKHLLQALRDVGPKFGVEPTKELADALAAKVISYRSLAVHHQKPGPRPVPEPRVTAKPTAAETPELPPAA